jgi:hypothetical protein
MNIIISILIMSLLSSCGFKSDEKAIDDGNEVTSIDTFTNENDSDGDFINDLDEVNNGRNPLVANLPELKIRFLQNYQITGDFKNKKTDAIESMLIDTKVRADDADFKYRVGSLFIRDNAFKNAASSGRFSSHSWGFVEDFDLTWVKYPEVDPSFYSSKAIEYKKLYNKDEYDEQSVSVKLENTVKLPANKFFKSVKNLELNFYYYNYQKESYELLDTKLVERHFNAGVTETFEVEISKIPSDLIEDNYFKKGEFIISEVNNFEIPDLKTDYQTLLASIKEKSIPVTYNTPLETKVFYVGLNGITKSFSSILSSLFDKKFTIESNVLTKVNQFENNLADFTYLSEVKDQEKAGKWFVFTNEINQHYLDYRFKKGDLISLSYLTGQALANQSNEKVYSYREKASSGDDFEIYPLGNISTNSSVDIQIQAKRKWGVKSKFREDDPQSSGGSCGSNCYSSPFKCHIQIHEVSSFDEEFNFSKELNDQFSRIELLINEDTFSLNKLIEEKKVSLKWIGDNIHLSIKDISKIKELSEAEENLISLRMTSLNEVVNEGITVVSYEGPARFTCIKASIHQAGTTGIPLNQASVDFNQWQSNVHWGRVNRGGKKHLADRFELSISTIVNNNFN